MATMISEVYDAFLEAGATPDKARKAAEALAGYEGRFSKLESEVSLLKWIGGFNSAVLVAVAVRLFTLNLG